MGDPVWYGNKLPPDLKMHQLLKLAMDDLEKTWAEIDAGEPVEIDMGDWFFAKDKYLGGECKRVCSVCFAGSVMHQSLGVPIVGEGFRRSVVLPSSFDDVYTLRCLRALNRLRAGEIGAAYSERNTRSPHDLIPLYMPSGSYVDNEQGRRFFQRDMQRIPDVLVRFDP